MIHYIDTVIIGGGPSGLSCALILQKNNISNIVIEKREFPREKTCGGLITNKTFKLISQNLGLADIEISSEIICDLSNIVELYYKNKLLTTSVISDKLRFVKRATFVNYLATKYKEIGGKLLENCSYTVLDLENHKIELTSGEIIEFEHIVVADGALSKTRKNLGYKTPELGFCVETFIPKSKLQNTEHVKIYFGIVEKGYAWIFPSGNEICIGLGGVYKKGVNYKAVLEEFLVSLGVNQNDYKIKGAFVPYGKPVNQKHGMSDDVILVGDAAGFVDPIHGEGLYFAIKSGIAAANAIINGKSKQEYLKQILPILKTIKQGDKLQNLFFQKSILQLFQKIIIGKDLLVAFYCDNQVSEYNYSYLNLWKFFWDYYF